MLLPPKLVSMPPPPTTEQMQTLSHYRSLAFDYLLAGEERYADSEDWRKIAMVLYEWSLNSRVTVAIVKDMLNVPLYAAMANWFEPFSGLGNVDPLTMIRIGDEYFAKEEKERPDG